jgi:hypothetical protein
MTTIQQIQMNLAGSGAGRVTLHLLCLCRDRKLRWHARGIGREFQVLGTVARPWFRAASRCAGRTPGTFFLRESMKSLA